MHDWRCNGSALESSFAGYCHICTGLPGDFPRILDSNCAHMLQLTVWTVTAVDKLAQVSGMRMQLHVCICSVAIAN